MSESLCSITLITTPAAGMRIIQALHRGGINTAATQRARGSTIGDRIGRHGVPVQREKELVTVVVKSDLADEIFQLLFQLSCIDDPRGGFIYMAKLARGSDYRLPEMGGR